MSCWVPLDRTIAEITIWTCLILIEFARSVKGFQMLTIIRINFRYLPISELSPEKNFEAAFASSITVTAVFEWDCESRTGYQPECNQFFQAVCLAVLACSYIEHAIISSSSDSSDLDRLGLNSTVTSLFWQYHIKAVGTIPLCWLTYSYSCCFLGTDFCPLIPRRCHRLALHSVLVSVLLPVRLLGTSYYQTAGLQRPYNS